MAVRNPLIFKSVSRSFMLETFTRATAADCMPRLGTPAASWTKPYSVLLVGLLQVLEHTPRKRGLSAFGACATLKAEEHGSARTPPKRPSGIPPKNLCNRFVPISAATRRNLYKTAVQTGRFVQNPAPRAGLSRVLPDLAALLISSTTYCVYPQQIALQVVLNRAPYLVGHGGILPCP